MASTLPNKRLQPTSSPPGLRPSDETAAEPLRWTSLMRLPSTLAALFFISAVAASSEVVVPVESISLERLALDNKKRLAPAYATARSTWQALKFDHVNYEISDDQAGSLIALACTEKWLRVTAYKDGRFSAEIVPGQGPCQRGGRIDAADFESRTLSPADLFATIERDLQAPLGRSGCIKAAFDDQTGLPTRLAFHCEGNVDDSSTISIRNIKIVR